MTCTVHTRHHERAHNPIQEAQRTVWNARSVAMQREFAPVILNCENWSARRTIAGWMSPLAALTGFCSPKCEKILSPPPPPTPAATTVSLVVDPAARVSLVARAGIAGEARGAFSVGLVRLRGDGAGPEEEGAAFAAAFPPDPLASPGAALAASFAALCFSWSSLRSALVISFCFGFESGLGPLGGCTGRDGVGIAVGCS